MKQKIIRSPSKTSEFSAEEYFKNLAEYRQRVPSKYDGKGNRFQSEEEAREYDKKTCRVSA
jgi:hypothetical protein